MFTRLLFLFTVVPALEFYLLIQLGQVLGALTTVGLILLTGVLGASMARSEGFAVLQRIQTEAAQGFPSGDGVAEGLLIVVGGVLLVTPGVLTDAVGLALIAPPTRRFLAPRVKAAFLARAQVVSTAPRGRRPVPNPPEPEEAAPEVSGPFDHPIA